MTDEITYEAGSGLATPPAKVQKKAAAKKAPPLPAPKPSRRGWTILTTLDRLLIILEETQPQVNADGDPYTPYSKADLLRDPANTFLEDLTAAELIARLRQSALEEALDGR